MNLFQKYGIKEVADVVFYSINKIGDEEFYTPVLFLDTLKVSTIEKTAEKVEAKGGKGNKKLITWNFGKEITLNLEDALFSPASMSMIWGGKLDTQLSKYTSAIVKCNMANKYGELHYSTKAYPSPALTDEEWEVIFDAAKFAGNMTTSDFNNLGALEVLTQAVYEVNTANIVNDTSITVDEYAKITYPDEYADFVLCYVVPPGQAANADDLIIQDGKNVIIDKDSNNNYRFWIVSPAQKAGLENLLSTHLVVTDEDKENMRYQYFRRKRKDGTQQNIAIPQYVIGRILEQITKLKDIGTVETDIHDIEVIDRWEKCIVKKKEGQQISLYEQRHNLERYYRDDRTSSYTIFYDAKTMQPLLPIKDGDLQPVNGVDFATATAASPGIFKIKIGTVYYKWTRTVKYKESEKDGILGRTFVIDAETFPDNYRIVGETYIRNQKTGKDQRYQFIIYRANVSSDTNVTLEAEGDPTTFSMQIDVLCPPNDIMMEFKQYDVEDDILEGGTRIVPVKSTYSYTPYNIDTQPKQVDSNDEIY